MMNGLDKNAPSQSIIKKMGSCFSPKTGSFLKKGLFLLAFSLLMIGGQTPDAHSVTNIMPLGDSITQGSGSTPTNGYRKELKESLAAAGHDVDFVGSKTTGTFPDSQHEGHPGSPTTNILANVTGYLTTSSGAGKPVDIILLHVGTNDISSGGILNTRPLIIERIGQILNIINNLDPTIRVILSKLIPTSDSSNGNTSQLNGDFQGLVGSHTNMTLVDVGVNMDPATDLQPSSVHPNNAGYTKMAAEWFTAVVAELGAPTTTPTNAAPSITSTAVTNGVVGQTYSYNVDATGFPLPTYSLGTGTTAPVTGAGKMAINLTTGLIQWTPSGTGTFHVEVKARNGETPVANSDQNFDITVEVVEVTDPVLTASSPDKLPTDDLTVTFTPVGSATSGEVVWTKNGTNVMTLFMPFEGGPNALTDISGNAHTVVSKGAGAAWSETNGHGLSPATTGGFLFNGSNGANGAVIDMGNILPLLSYTKAAWLKRTSNAGHSMNFLSGNSDRFFFVRQNSQRNGGMPNSYRLTAGHNPKLDVVEDPETLPLDTWVHVAVTYDKASKTMILYKNGVEVDFSSGIFNEAAGTGVPNFSDRRVMIGSLGGGNRWVGNIDDVRIYDHVLSADQIAALAAGDSNKIVASETQANETWIAHVTPFSADLKGAAVPSNALTIANKHVMTVTAGANGEISWDFTSTGGSAGMVSAAFDTVLVNDAASPAFTITPSIGFHIDTVLEDGVAPAGLVIPESGPLIHTFSLVDADHSLSATFAQNGNLITTTITGPTDVGATVTDDVSGVAFPTGMIVLNGDPLPAFKVVLNAGSLLDPASPVTVTETANPAVPVPFTESPAGVYTLNPNAVNTALTITVPLVLEEHAITTAPPVAVNTGASGTVSLIPPTVTHGSALPVFTVEANPGSKVVNVVVTKADSTLLADLPVVNSTTLGNYTLSGTVTEPLTITVTFDLIGHDLTPSITGVIGGAIVTKLDGTTPLETVVLNNNPLPAFKIKLEPGSVLGLVTVTGANPAVDVPMTKNADDSYTPTDTIFTVTAPLTINVPLTLQEHPITTVPVAVNPGATGTVSLIPPTVTHGSALPIFTVAANPGSKVVSVVVTKTTDNTPLATQPVESSTTPGNYTLSGTITEPLTVTVTFDLIGHDITPNITGGTGATVTQLNGSALPPKVLNNNALPSFKITLEAGSVLGAVTVTKTIGGATVGFTASTTTPIVYTLSTNVTTPLTINVPLTLQEHEITPVVVRGNNGLADGTMAFNPPLPPSGTITHGSPLPGFTLSPAGGSKVVGVVITKTTGGVVPHTEAGGVYTLTGNVTAPLTVTATFGLIGHEITINVAGEVGTSAIVTDTQGVDLPTIVLNNQALPDFKVTLDQGSDLVDVVVTKLNGTGVLFTVLEGVYHLSANVTAPLTITVNLKLKLHVITTLTPGGNGGTVAFEAPGLPIPPTVTHGNSLPGFKVTPATGSELLTVLVTETISGNAVSALKDPATGVYTLANPVVNVPLTITATFKLLTYTVTPVVSGLGTISPAVPQTVDHGATPGFTVTPDANQHIVNVTLTPGGLLTTTTPGTYTLPPVTGDVTITATFALNRHTLTTRVIGNGSFTTPLLTPIVDHDATPGFSLEAALNHHIVDVVLTPGDVVVLPSEPGVYTLPPVQGDLTITATFAIDTHTITTVVVGGNGSVSNADAAGKFTVNHDANQVLDLSPALNYHVASVVIGIAEVVPVPTTAYLIQNVIADVTVTVIFKLNSFTLSATAGTNGSITPSGTTGVSFGDSLTFAITPETNYHVSKVLVDGTDVGAQTSFAFTGIDRSHTIAAFFEIDQHLITVTAGPNGSISPSLTVSVPHGADQLFAVIPALNHHIVDVTVDTVSVGAVSAHTILNVTVDHAISATFAPDTFVITANAGINGAIEPSGAVPANGGSSQTFTITPDLNENIVDVLVDGVSQGPTITTFTFSNITADHSINAIFATNTHFITASAGGNGTITPAGGVEVVNGGDQAFTMVADANHHLDDVMVDKISLGPVLSHTVTNVTTNQIIEAFFLPDTYTITAASGNNGSISPNGTSVVTHGASLTVTITPDINHHILDVVVDGISKGAVSAHLFENVTSVHTIVASFAVDTHDITATAGAGGSLAPSGTVPVGHGAGQNFSIIPDPGFDIADVLVDGASQGAIASFSFTNVIVDGHTIHASFARKPYSIGGSAGANGSITPATAIVNHGENSLPFNIAANPNYHIVEVLVDGATQGAIPSFTFINVTAPHTISATFAINVHTITAMSGGNGSISPFPTAIVNHGGSQTFTMTPDVNHHILDIKVDGLSVGTVTPHTILDITANRTIHVTFAPDTHVITATSGENGNISPVGPVDVVHGGSQEFTFTPDAGFQVADVLVDGGSEGAVATFTVTDVTVNRTISVSFEAIPDTGPPVEVAPTLPAEGALVDPNNALFAFSTSGLTDTTHQLCLSEEDDNFDLAVDCTTVPDATALLGKGMMFAGVGATGIGFLWLAGSVLGAFMKRSKTMLLALLVVAGLLLSSCSGGGGGGAGAGGGIPGVKTLTVSAPQALKPDTTYFWKVIATRKGKTTETTPRSFKTLPSS